MGNAIQRASNLTQCHFLRRHDCLYGSCCANQSRFPYRGPWAEISGTPWRREAYTGRRSICSCNSCPHSCPQNVCHFLPLRHEGFDWCCDRYGQPHVWCRSLLAWHNQYALTWILAWGLSRGQPIYQLARSHWCTWRYYGTAALPPCRLDWMCSWHCAKTSQSSPPASGNCWSVETLENQLNPGTLPYWCTQTTPIFCRLYHAVVTTAWKDSSPWTLAICSGQYALQLGLTAYSNHKHNSMLTWST